MLSARRFFLPAALAACLTAIACDQPPTRPAAGTAALHVYANLVGAPVSLLVVEVTAPDISTPLVFNIPVTGTSGYGTITVPAGSDRTIRMRAFDRSSIETHRGVRTVDIREGTNPTISMQLQPLQGQQPIDVYLGSSIVAVSPYSPVLTVGDTLRMMATVFDENGNEIAAPIRWATLDPGKASVDSTGLVQARDAGVVEIVATSGGFGGSTTLYINPPDVTGAKLWIGGALGVPDDWSVSGNWWPIGVPSASDSAIVRANSLTMPRLSADASVGALVVNAGATLDTWGYALSVNRSLVSEGTIGGVGGIVLAGAGMQVRGSLPNVNVTGSAALTGPVTAAGDFYVRQTGSLDVAGRHLTVGGAMVVADTARLVMQNPTDTVDVAGPLYFDTYFNHDGYLTTGVLRLASDFYAWNGFTARASHVVMLDGSGAQSLQGMGEMGVHVQNLLIQSLGDVSSSCGLTAYGTLRIETPVALTETCQLQVDGVLSSVPGSTVTAYQLVLSDVTAMDSIGGLFNNTYLSLPGSGQRLRGGLAYSNVAIGGSVVARDTVTISGYLDLLGSLTIDSTAHVNVADFYFELGSTLVNDGGLSYTTSCINYGGSAFGAYGNPCPVAAPPATPAPVRLAPSLAQLRARTAPQDRRVPRPNWR